MLRKSIMTAGLLLGLAMNGAASDGLTYLLNYNDYTCTVTCRDNDEVSGSVTIPDYYDGYRVIGINENAFYGNDKITSITISDNVEYIGELAFTGCTNLKSIKLPYNLKSIASNAFSGDLAFSRCRPETVYLDNVAGWCEMSITGGYTFDNPLSAEHVIINGEETTTLEIPEGVERIENQAFIYAHFTEVKFPSTLKRIGFKAFAYCSPLKSLEFPDALESMGACSFEGCYNITNISFGKGIKYIGRSAFYSSSRRPSIYFVSCPDMETWLGIEFGVDPLYPEENRDYYGANPLQYAQHFYVNGQEITDLLIPAGVEDIKPGAFYGGNMLISVKLPDGVTTIGNGAFSGYHSYLKRVDFPKSLKELGAWAFNVEKLDEIHCNAINPPSAYESTFSSQSSQRDYIYNNAVLYVPIGSLEAYKGHDVWGKFADIREEGVSEVAAVGVSGSSVEVGADGIRVDAPDGDAHVEVYSIAGTKCYSGAAGVIALPQGWYVVVVNGTAHKVVIR